MHILAALGAVLGVLVFILFRMQQAANAARDIADVAGDARGLFRRWGWRRKLAKHPLETIDDAREAVAAMMVAVAQADGAITERERIAITGEMTKRFGATAAGPAHMRAHGTLRPDRDAGQCRRRRWAHRRDRDTGHRPAGTQLEVIVMITPQYVRSMAVYNRWQNENLYGTADGLSDEVRKLERGAFFGSIHRTLNHLVWAEKVDPVWLQGDLTWFSGGAKRELTKPTGLLVTHMFNHQTHHRGQVHCMLTQCGVKPGVTDLPFRNA